LARLVVLIAIGVLRSQPIATVLIFAGSISCTSPPRSPGQGGHAWLEVTTERFVLHTDFDEPAARSAAHDFETAYLYLEQVAFPGYTHPTQRVDVVLFRDHGEFHGFWPRDMKGFYVDRPPQDLERSPTMVLYGDLHGDASEVFLHELTHRFITRAYGWAPPWMHEGLAEYFSTMRVEGGQAILGTVPEGVLIAPSLVPTVRELVIADHSAFYGAWTGEDYDGLHRARYYAGAYALVHLMRNGPDPVRRRFDVFVAAMNAGARADRAWAESFGVIAEESLEKAFRSHLAAWREWDLFGARVDSLPAAVPEQVRTMSDVEVHLLWARILRARGDNVPIVREQLDEAGAQAPTSPLVAYARGCFEVAQQRLDAARPLFETALAGEPDNPHFLFAVLLVRLRSGEAPAAVADLLDRLARVAKTADQLGAVALYESARGDQAAAMRRAEEAVASDPGYAGALAIRARVRFLAGDYEAAITDQERALTLLPEQIDDRPFVRVLDEYRRARPSDSAAGK
jgi:tetratricopeptide (TPR) repeat protein